ncbi:MULTISPECIES: hypothetical protein [unclassified Mycolicibacterium]|uniref:hypothetical protein n=1 Tax=unclassified Mycolicibacterium TaxID=2636767 RepID=UPI001390C2C7|nr:MULTISPECIES: hypothetical protein [unclassified Mycolicibacterium]
MVDGRHRMTGGWREAATVWRRSALGGERRRTLAGHRLRFGGVQGVGGEPLAALGLDVFEQRARGDLECFGDVDESFIEETALA